MSQHDLQARLTEYLRDNGIAHFSGREVLTLRRLGRVAGVPPEAWWPRILPALIIAERIRKELGHGLVVGNGYRPAALNKAAGGSRTSQHIQFRALDLDLPAKHNTRDSQEALYRAAGEAYLDVGKSCRMGLGVYRPSRGPRVHVDCGHRQRKWGGPKTRFGWRTKAWVNDLLEGLR